MFFIKFPFKMRTVSTKTWKTSKLKSFQKSFASRKKIKKQKNQTMKYNFVFGRIRNYNFPIYLNRISDGD